MQKPARPATQRSVTARIDEPKAGGTPAPKQAAQSQKTRGSQTNSPREVKGREVEVANALLNLEREARRSQSEAELGYLMVNGSRVAVQYRQAMLLLRSGPNKQRVVSVSSLSAVDRNSTFIRWIERLVARRVGDGGREKVLSFDARRDAKTGDPDASAYPFAHMALLPLQLRDGTVFAHLLFTREAEWDERSLVAAARLCETFSHAWEALVGPKKAKRKLRSRQALGFAVAATVLLAGFIPMPLSVLAPARVAPADAYVVAAPMDGVIETIEISPNTRVKAGDLLFRYSDTDLRNRLQLAGQAVSVAEARYDQSLRTSFSDSRAKRELSIAKSELNLKAGEYDYASELMKKTVVGAPRDGLVLFSDKDTWTGRPVATGERIMRIADPNSVEIAIDLPVADAIVLEEGARVQLYLDSNPLKPVEGKLTSASFHAQPNGDNVLSYNVRADFTEADRPRIGLRGTAKVYGERVTLAYYLFRKPLSAIRQWTGY